jgi:hypothetical protein
MFEVCPIFPLFRSILSQLISELFSSSLNAELCFYCHHRAPAVEAKSHDVSLNNQSLKMVNLCFDCYRQAPSVGKTSSHFLKPLFAILKVRTKSGLSHMMMVHTQATSLKPLFPLVRVDCRKGAQYILGTEPTFLLFCPNPAL